MNYYYLLIPLLLSIVIIILLYLQNNKKKKLVEKLIFEKHDLEVLRKNELKDYFEEEWKKGENELELRLSSRREAINSESTKLESNFKLKENEFVNALKNLQIQLNEKEARYVEVNQDLNLYKEGKMKEIDGTAAEYKEHQQTIIKNELEKYREDWTNKFNEDLAKLSEVREEKLNELEKINAELEEERTRRAAINEEILRQRALDEQQDFYRIQLDPDDIQDIELLRSIVSRLRHPEAINKVIWSGYYQKPLAELRKRVAIEGPGIYKITRIKTNEIYIGQAVNVSTRWAEHCKAALGVGTLASSQLHRVMAQDGCENFTFELLEAVPKEKLRERESYYIDFYDSKNYGLNTISGDKNK